jgi:aquaporin related protein
MAPLRNILPIHKREAPAASGEPKNGNHPHTDRSKNPMNAWVTNRWRNEIVAALAEFAGTFMFLCKSACSFSHFQPWSKHADEP